MFGNLHTKRWAGAFLVIGGVCLFVVGIWWAVESSRFLAASARAQGDVIELRRVYGSKGLPLDHPIVRFTVPQTGRTVVFRSRVGFWPSPFSVGEQVEIAYAPADPDRAKIKSFWTVWLPSLVISLFGAACFGAGMATLRRLARKPGPGGS